MKTTASSDAFVRLVTVALLALGACADAPDNEMAVRDAMHGMLEDFRAGHAIPGITAAIVLDDGRAVSAATGLADRELERPMTPETPMLAASIGKTFVAATVLSLAKNGRLAIDHPLSRYLSDRPWFERLPNGDRITLKHLLSHSSGLVDHVHDAGFAAAFAQRVASDTPPFTAEELVGFVLDDAALFEPGAGWSYSDTGYVLLGMVIEELTGEPWTEEVERRFLEPLRLDDTRASDGKDLPGLAAGYLAEDKPFGLPVKSIGADGRMTWNPAVENAGGGFASTSPGLARWGDALFRGRAIPADALGRMLEGVPVSPDDPDRRYGLGVSIYRRGEFGPVYGHAGWIPGYVSSLRHYPDHGVTVAFQVNTDVGLADNSDALAELERRLAETALSWRDDEVAAAGVPLSPR